VKFNSNLNLQIKHKTVTHAVGKLTNFVERIKLFLGFAYNLKFLVLET